MSHFNGAETLVPGALRVYRTWAWDGLTLRAVNWPEVAWSGRHDAFCVNAECGALTPHRVPGQYCQCGIYGWYHPADTDKRIQAVFGVIEVSGRVVLGDKGVRAEHGRVLAVTHAQNLNLPALHAWCMREGVTFFDTPAGLLTAYPPEDVRQLVPTVDEPHAPVVPRWVMHRRAAWRPEPPSTFDESLSELHALLRELGQDMAAILDRALGRVLRYFLPGVGVHR